MPDGLKPQEVERNSTHKAPCPYVPEQDEVEAKLELKTQYAKFAQPNGVELKHPVYNGVGNSKKFLTHTLKRWGSRKSKMRAWLTWNRQRMPWNRPSQG